MFSKRAYSVIIGIVLALALVLVGCSKAGNASGAGDGKAGTASLGKTRTVEEIKKAGTIKIGVFSDKAPFGYVDNKGNYAGYDIEYGNRIAKDLGVKVEYVPVEAASRVEFLETNKVDIILANFTVTPERAEKVDFANPYMKVSLGVVSPTDNQVKDPKDLKDRKVIIVKGTTADTYLSKNLPEVKAQKFEQYTEVTSALSDKRGDAWVTDNTEALAWAGNNPGFTTSIPSFGTPDTIAAAVAKGNANLKDWINNHLVTLGKENFFHKNYEKTLKPVYGTAVNPDELVVEGGVVTK
ncbi:transporter substrate-binding domain-containing protein [Actinotignum urinale]|uniref:Transporter substrate-binding domain-containing protein n=1 Tax=Actinotignum urinale TaxID=190146 RepID=A0ABU5G4T5_9ACTO|nr:transporter substrate-binding domain-containing protein [Actinotignum urinale]MDY5132390.1 transporter substrate-binding domain-containing protein [Actinotignum urinale]